MAVRVKALKVLALVLASPLILAGGILALAAAAVGLGFAFVATVIALVVTS